jgi:molybdenum cofactor synthesis domain-containing protein
MGSQKTACLIIIGNEILSGRTQDANLSYLGRRCDELGVPLLEARAIPDVEETIIASVNACRAAFDYVFTTGGIGPTHDDITAAAIARAFGVEVVRNPDAVAAMDAYYEPGRLNDARLKMADIPAGAALIPNPVSGAPGFQLENVFVLPGVPMIMQAMFEEITDRLTGGAPILSDSIRTNLREGAIAEGLGRIQAANPETGIGSYPYFRHGRLGVNLVIRSTEQARIETVKREILGLIQELQGRVLE